MTETEMDLDTLAAEMAAEKQAGLGTRPMTKGNRRVGKQDWRPICMCGHPLGLHSPGLVPEPFRDRYPWDFQESTRSRSTRIVQQAKYGVEGCFGPLQHYGKYDDRASMKSCACEGFDHVLDAKRLGHYFRQLPSPEQPALYLGIQAATEYLLGDRGKPPAAGAKFRWAIPQRCHRCDNTGAGVLPYYVGDEASHTVRLGCRTCRTAALGGRPI